MPARRGARRERDAAVLKRDGKTILSYGSAERLQAAPRAGSRERHGVDPARVCITNGALQGFVLFARARRAGSASSSSSRPMTGRSRSCGSSGRDRRPSRWTRRASTPDALEAALADAENAGVPLHDSDLPEPERPDDHDRAARTAIVELARAHDLLVLEDDPYGLVRFEGEPQPRCSSSPAATPRSTPRRSRRRSRPGMRVGWYILPPELRAELERAATSTYITPGAGRTGDGSRVLQGGRFESNVARVNVTCSRRQEGRDARGARPSAARVPRGRGRMAVTSSGSISPGSTAAKDCSSGRSRRDVRSRSRLRRRAVDGAARLQLRVARRDQRRRRAARRRAL